MDLGVLCFAFFLNKFVDVSVSLYQELGPSDEMLKIHVTLFVTYSAVTELGTFRVGIVTLEFVLASYGLVLVFIEINRCFQE